jgi:thiamine biosynthesis lipoprotein
MNACIAELARLEAIFSLHRPDSALSRLNREGRLAEPPSELVELLAQAILISRLSDGRFDPTVQPLWTLIADHFASGNADPAGPDHGRLAAARALVDFRAIELTADRIALARPGMQISLNGIAQGYISDRAGELLKARGFRHALVNLGETLAIDRRGDGRAWRIGIPAPADRSRLVTSIDLEAGAVATSAARGLFFETTGRFNHIIDPRRLACADPDRSVSVVAPAAATADGLSTWAALVSDPRDLRPHLARFSARAFVISKDRPDGEWLG